MKLAVFDFDSTLMDGETLEFLAREAGIEDKIKKITDSAMRGEIDFFESLKQRVSMLKGLDLDTVNRVCENLPLMAGAKLAVKELKNNGYKVVCFSGGFKNATVPFVEKLGLDCEFSNILHVKNGFLTGDLGGEMMFSDSKGKMLKRLQILTDTSYDDTLVVGDGANDLSMFKYASKKAAFCAKPILKENANIIIDEKDLSILLDYLK